MCGVGTPFEGLAPRPQAILNPRMMKTEELPMTSTNMTAKHPEGRISNSDWFVNSFIMSVRNF